MVRSRTYSSEECRWISMNQQQQRRFSWAMPLGVMLPLVMLLLMSTSIVSKEKYVGLTEAFRRGLSWELRNHTADTVFTNAVIWTGNSSQPWAQCMAVRDGHILSIGSLNQVQHTIGPHTEVVNLDGKFVTPGFIDSHVHFISGGLQMAQVDLSSVRSHADIASKLRLAAEGTKKGQWILGGGWNNENWGGELPEASWIDSVTPDHPVWVYRSDGHMGLANSVALALAGIDHDVQQPQGGIIIRDSHGDPTGVLLDAAMALLIPCIPEPSVEERRAALSRASQMALARGVTSVIDFGRSVFGARTQLSWADLDEVYMWADAAGEMRTRVSVFLPLETWPTVAVKKPSIEYGRTCGAGWQALVRQRGHMVSQWLRIGGVKAFADGSLGSRTALFHMPYADDDSNYGLRVADPEWLGVAVIGADNAGLQVAVHAIGDAANDEVLSVVETVQSKNGPRDRRFRIEHAQHLSSGAPARFAANDVIASVQTDVVSEGGALEDPPDHMLDDAQSAAKKLGEKRSLEGSYLFNSLLGNGTRLVLGSDWSVVPLIPLRGMQTAMRRIPNGLTSSWIPSEIISSEAALTGYTVGAAYASFMDTYVGSLSPGKYADFVVLSNNIVTEGLTDYLPSVQSTYVGGLVAYSKCQKPVHYTSH